MKPTNHYLTLLFCCVLVLASCQNRGDREEAMSYKLLEITPSDISVTSSYSAAIKGKQDVKIIPNVSGYLHKVCVVEGDCVKAGQTLFVIDQVPYRAALQGAKATVSVCKAAVSTAQLNYDSKRTLYEKKIVSEFDLKSADNALKTAKAQEELARSQEMVAANNLSYTVVKSPSDGVVGKLPYRTGDYVSPSIQDGLTVVADNTRMYVYFSFTENQVLDLLNEYKNLNRAIKELPDVELQLNNKTIYAEKGRIESISGVIDSRTGSVSVKAVFGNEDKTLLSGGSGNVLMTRTRRDVIVIPQEATYEVQDKVYVFKVVDGVAKSTVVTVSKMKDNKTYIVEQGLKNGDTIIAEGAGLVRDGSKVSMSVKQDK